MICVEKTAIPNGVATSVRQNIGHIHGEVLDYGTGKMRNALYLVSLGYPVSILDTPLQINRLPLDKKNRMKSIYTSEDDIVCKFNTVFCTFVLNVVPESDMRNHILEHIVRLLEDDGHAIIEVRRTRGIESCKHKEPYLDGYLVGNGKTRTFQKGYESEEFSNLVSQYFEIVSIHTYSDSLSAVLRRKS